MQIIRASRVIRCLGLLPHVLALVLGFARLVPAAAAEISWAIADYPPVFIFADNHEPVTPAELGNGIGDQLIRALATRMPEYEHHLVIVSTARLWAEFESGHNLCYAATLKTPDRSHLVYLTPIAPSVSRVVIARKGILAGLSRDGTTISLKDLLAHREYSGILQTKRSYGPAIDAVLAARSDANVAYEVLAKPALTLRMLRVARMDFTIDYASVAGYEIARAGEPALFDIFTISEDLDPPPIYVACTRNDWGRRTIAEIDQQIRQLSLDPEFRGIIATFMTPLQRSRVQERLDVFYSQRASRSELE